MYDGDEVVYVQAFYRNPMLRNRLLPNCELTHHMLQLGASVLMLESKEYNLTKKVEGTLLRVYVGGEIRHWPLAWYARDKRMYSASKHPLVNGPIQGAIPWKKGVYRGIKSNTEEPVYLVESNAPRDTVIQDLRVKIGNIATPYHISIRTNNAYTYWYTVTEDGISETTYPNIDSPPRFLDVPILKKSR